MSTPFRSPLIAVARGDGIGPEIMAATLSILKEAGTLLNIQEVEISEKVYQRGEQTGLSSATWEIIRQSDAFLKAPVTTPQGKGFKSLNVTLRTTLGLYANIRPCLSYYPFIATKHPHMDVVIIRENEEDLYVGIEYRLTPQTYQALKVMTRPGCERIIRYAFEYARTHQRKKVSCFTKDNILKLSDGLFHHVFEEIGADYPDLEKEHWIVDIGMAKIVDRPEEFDVVVLPNLYGDILSDVTAQIAGSVGLAGSANIGTAGAMFEAIHGSAPLYAGKDMANPSGLLLAAIQMLIYIGQPEGAAHIHNAWLRTIEEGIHTFDIYQENSRSKKVGTKEFAQAVIHRLGQKPQYLSSVHYEKIKQLSPQSSIKAQVVKKECMGVDVFIEWELSLETLIAKLKHLVVPALQLTGISNRAVWVWPHPLPETVHSDSWRCRLMRKNADQLLTFQTILELLQKMNEHGLHITQTHSLFLFDGQRGFTPLEEE